ncbi:hypothetical protein [Nonomuraea sp. B5E05]|uniref:hypothetical protein n=1 Tax=Nonomuraea sp. B5E05 TaxID=3153569 RepID=UPI003260872C
MRVIIDRALALVLPEEKAAAVCAYQYKCFTNGWHRRLCCSSSADNCSPWQRLGPSCPV